MYTHTYTYIHMCHAYNITWFNYVCIQYFCVSLSLSINVYIYIYIYTER